ncbi:MAG TPA: SRPBCC domain-containing protein [Solirubrobacteraceae bacterium]|nr:SRPBCC domain-containing protein [Solirubrobacteraceae bacterium]
MDDVFKALADPTRRAILDELYREDGQTLSALERQFAMTRIGVMKHLRVLELAGLIVTRRRGREKLHFLNAVPIQLVHERWVSKYAEPWAATLTGLKRRLEGPMQAFDEIHTVVGDRGTMTVFEIYIKATPERVWAAITDGEQRRLYSFGVGTQSDWREGSSYSASAQGGFEIAAGRNLEVEPPRRLVQSFYALWSEEVRAAGESRVTWEIEPVADSCRLTVIHDQLRDGANDELYGGWPMILSGLKTLLETGEQLTTPGSLMYAA